MPSSETHPEQARAWAMPIEEIDVGRGYLFEQDVVEFYFERLRLHDPVHLTPSKRFGPYWSVTRYKDIMAVDTNHAVFSSESSLGGIALAERPAPEMYPSFIAMDPPRHDEQRKAVSPIVAPGNLALLEATIRERVSGSEDPEFARALLLGSVAFHDGNGVGDRHDHRGPPVAAKPSEELCQVWPPDRAA